MQLTTLVFPLLHLALLAQAQIIGTSNVTCLPGFSWVLNGIGQTPCLVAGYLASECYGGPWNVPPLPIGTGPGSSAGPYNSPGIGGSQPSLCRCNTVEYNLIQACSLCQGGLVGSWSSWISQCTNNLVTVGKYPESVPDGTAIPTYAFYDSSGGQFDPNAAQNYASDHSGKKQKHKGAIIGGVIGGFFIVVAFFTILAYILRPQWFPKKCRREKDRVGEKDPNDPENYPNSADGSAHPTPAVHAVFKPTQDAGGLTGVSAISDLPQPVYPNPADGPAFGYPTSASHVEYSNQANHGHVEYPNQPAFNNQPDYANQPSHNNPPFGSHENPPSVPYSDRFAGQNNGGPYHPSHGEEEDHNLAIIG